MNCADRNNRRCFREAVPLRTRPDSAPGYSARHLEFRIKATSPEALTPRFCGCKARAAVADIRSPRSEAPRLAGRSVHLRLRAQLHQRTAAPADADRACIESNSSQLQPRLNASKCRGGMQCLILPISLYRAVSGALLRISYGLNKLSVTRCIFNRDEP